MVLRHSLLVLSAFAAASVSAEAQRRGEGLPTEEATRHALDGYLTKYFTAADIEAARRARSSIVALGAYGEFVTQVPHGILIRERSGWTVRSGGRNQPLPADVSRRIDQILADRKFWSEASFDPRQLCTGGARLMTVRHAGRVKTTRQSCGPAGLAGALSEIAVSGRLPVIVNPTRPELPRLTVRPSTNEREFPTQDPAVSEAIWERTQSATMAWNRGDLDAFLAPYADDVTIVWPSGIEYHKPALRTRTLPTQRWNGRPDREMEVRSSMVRQLGPYSALQTYQLRFSGAGRPATQMWVTAIWQNRRGSWEITHEQPGAETAATAR